MKVPAIWVGGSLIYLLPQDLAKGEMRTEGLSEQCPGCSEDLLDSCVRANERAITCKCGERYEVFQTEVQG